MSGSKVVSMLIPFYTNGTEVETAKAVNINNDLSWTLKPWPRKHIDTPEKIWHIFNDSYQLLQIRPRRHPIRIPISLVRQHLCERLQ